MDFLKSAVASAISKASAFPYSFDERIDVDASVWALYNGTKREDGSRCSIFSFDVSGNRSKLPLARNALRKFKTLRHPGLIKVIDTFESEQHIYVATERLTPASWQIKRKSMPQETVKWGLHSIAKVIRFINNDASSVHGYIRSSSVFITESGEWKLGGFDILSSMKEDDAVIYSQGSSIPDWTRYCPPEISKSGWSEVAKFPIHAVDAFMYGILIYEAFNGSFGGPDQLTMPKNIPVGMQPGYKRLISANPKVRISVAQFLEQGIRDGGFFHTPLILLTDGIENLGVKNEQEREEVLSTLEDLADDFPADYFKAKVLPELIKSVEFGGGGPKVFSAIMKISSKLTSEEYQEQLVPVIVRLFSSQDRALRVTLLEDLPLMIDHLSQKIVSNNIFPQIVTGFSDVVPVVREQTVKAVLSLAPKLSDRILNGELLRHLAKTANDEQPGIRTNTTICLGKISKHLSSNTRTKVLTAAFARALRDPFVHARVAALMALAATSDIYSDDDCATKILPGICPSLIDKEKMVRDQANKTLEVFLQRVRKFAQSLPETLEPQAPSNKAPDRISRTGTPQPDAPSWTGWAMSSFTNKLASVSGQMQTEGTAETSSAPNTRPNSVPPAKVERAGPPSSSIQHIKSSALAKTVISPPPVIAPPPPPAGPFSLMDEPVEDFNASWGGGNEWATADDDPFAPKAKGSSNFDLNADPDFEGWLNAQSQSKAGKKPLPKGLAKSKTSKTSSTGKALPKSTSAAKSTLATRSKQAPKPKADDDDWGDSWD